MDEFREAQSILKRPHGYKAWWETLDLTDRQREDLMAAGADPDISHRAILIVLKQWGHKVSLGQIGHWRRTHLGMLLR
jgi:hypothetical protein